MLLDDLYLYLNPFILLYGVPVQKGYFIETPDTAVALRETGGFPSEHVMIDQPAVLDQPTVQVVTRSRGYEEAMFLCRDLYARFDGLRDVVINSVTYHFITAMQPPFFLQRDDNHRFECAFNIHIQRSVT